MRKRALAIWPLAVKLRPSEPQYEQWNQEQEKLRNEKRVVESAQEKIDRLIPGLEIKRLVL